MFFAAIAAVMLLTAGAGPHAQAETGTLRIAVRSDSGAVEGALVSSASSKQLTNTEGVATLTLPIGTHALIVTKDGFIESRVTADVTAAPATLQVLLVPEPAIEEEVTVIATTRTGRTIEDQPMRVEVLVREEIEEKMLMTPGDIVMMLNEMGGMRVQATSPSLGAASVRIQGMRGRYTRFLSDGLPLFGEVGGLGLLQIPPMDLGQVEVIKGTASSLYGAGAMGGVVNLISRRPADEADREVMINRSSRGATDAIVWLAAPVGRGWSATALGGGHWQEQTDVDGDSWADLAGYARGIFRPRVFWDSGRGRSFFATAGLTIEDREGGTLEDATLAATGLPYREALETRRMDVGLLGHAIVAERFLITSRAAFSRTAHDHTFGDVFESARHSTAFGEVAIRGSAGRHTWVGGAAVERDVYRSDQVARFDHTFTVPGIFIQDDFDVADRVSMSASARLDHHSAYGTFISPRLSAVVRAGEWTARLSGGTGFFGPSALTEETEASGLTRLRIPVPLRAERGRSASLDITRSAGALSYTATLFASRIEDPIDVDRSERLVLTNAERPATNAGIELLATLRREPFALTGSYTFVRSRELEDGRMLEAELTPRHSAGLVGMWEREEAGRVGVEIYYTGRQRLVENPFATKSRPYLIIGLLAERSFRAVRLFINGENLTGVRQSRWDPLLRPARGADGRWTVDAWAPLEGRAVNGGLRFRF